MGKAAKACMKKGGKVQAVAGGGKTRREKMDNQKISTGKVKNSKAPSNIAKGFAKGGEVSLKVPTAPSVDRGVARGMGAAKRGGNYSC